MGRDNDLFNQAMAGMGVKPLHESNHPKRPVRGGGRSEWYDQIDDPPPEPQKRDSAVDPDTAMFLEAVRNTRAIPDKDQTPEDAPQKQKLHKMRSLKGDFPVPREEIDLHGFTRQEAVEKLAPFVARAFTKNQKAVTVITGKGLHSKQGHSVVKREVENWIQQGGKRFVKAYAEAPRSMGGSGALILFLREK